MLSLTRRMSDQFGAFMGTARAWPSRVRQLYTAAPAGAVVSETDLARSQAVYEGLKDLELLDAIQVMGGRSLGPDANPPPPAPDPGAAYTQSGHTDSIRSAHTVVQGGKIGGTFCTHKTYKPDTANLCLDRVARVWGGVYEAGGPAPYCNPSDPMTCGREPWKEMPAAGKRFQKTGSIPRPGVEGVDFLVLAFPVPDSWDGVLITITNQWDGAGFVDGSGDLRWRLMLDNQWLKDLDDIRITLGRLENPYELEGAGYRLQSHQQLRYFVQLGPGALGRLDPNGRVTCACSGWFYPRS